MQGVGKGTTNTAAMRPTITGRGHRSVDLRPVRYFARELPLSCCRCLSSHWSPTHTHVAWQRHAFVLLLCPLSSCPSFGCLCPRPALPPLPLLSPFHIGSVLGVGGWAGASTAAARRRRPYPIWLGLSLLVFPSLLAHAVRRARRLALPPTPTLCPRWVRVAWRPGLALPYPGCPHVAFALRLPRPEPPTNEGFFFAGHGPFLFPRGHAHPPPPTPTAPGPGAPRAWAGGAGARGVRTTGLVAVRARALAKICCHTKDRLWVAFCHWPHAPTLHPAHPPHHPRLTVLSFPPARHRHRFSQAFPLFNHA